MVLGWGRFSGGQIGVFDRFGLFGDFLGNKIFCIILEILVSIMFLFGVSFVSFGLMIYFEVLVKIPVVTQYGGPCNGR